MKLGIITFNITLSIITHSIMSLFVTPNINDTQHK
jgi:hypothetical protein